MLVRHHMSEKVVKIGPAESVATARKILQQQRIHHLPVVVRDRLVGIVTDRDLRSAPAAAQSVQEIMSTELITIPVDSYVDHAAQLMRRHRVGALPVVDKGRLVGILATADVLDAFVSLSGVHQPTYELVLTGVSSDSAAQRVRVIIEQRRGVVKWMHRERRDSTGLHLRLKAIHLDDISDALEAAGFTVSSIVAPPTR